MLDPVEVMRFDVVTIFPAMFDGVLSCGVLGQAVASGLIGCAVHDLREWADPPHHKVDDEVYGGGAGMLFCAEPFYRAICALRRDRCRTAIVATSPRGETLSHGLAYELADYEQVIILSDRYEGTDGRVAHFLTHEVSLGDYVLTGGELGAMVIVDTVARLQPGVVGKKESVDRDSYAVGLLEHDGFTRPTTWQGEAVPGTLLSGNHGEIERFRGAGMVRRTLEWRPELLRGIPLSNDEKSTLAGERADARYNIL